MADHTIKVQPRWLPKADGGTRVIPELRLRGVWLADAGFLPGDRVVVSMETVNGRECLVIREDEASANYHEVKA